MRFAPMLAVLVLFTLQARVARAEEFVVGSGAYAELADVPWASLGPGDVVTIPYRAAPYRETFAITTSGSEEAPIVVRGTRGPGGERPVIDGEDAVAGADTHVRALLSLRSGASHIVIEGLEFVHAHVDYAHDGLFPLANASGIYVESASHVVVRDCVLHGNGNGLFSAPGTADLQVIGNHLFGNGNVGSTQEHNSYTESDGILFEGNRYGALCEGCRGNNLKDRSAGTIVRYNFIDGGNRPLDLVEAETDDDDFNERVASSVVYVYGNVLVKRDETTQSQVVHFGGDNGGTALYRRTLRFYNNTVYSTRATRTTFFHFDAPAPDVDVRNSIFVVTTSPEIYLLDSSTSTGADVALANVYLPPDWDVSVAAALDAVVTTTAVTTGSSPGFVDAASLDFHLSPTADVRDAGTAQVAGAPPVLREYVAHQTTTARLVDGPIDLGAFEICEGECVPVTAPDGGLGSPDGGPGPGPAEGGDGCGCRAQPGGATPATITLAALLGLVVLRRGRRRD